MLCFTGIYKGTYPVFAVDCGFCNKKTLSFVAENNFRNKMFSVSLQKTISETKCSQFHCRQAHNCKELLKSFHSHIALLLFTSEITLLVYTDLYR